MIFPALVRLRLFAPVFFNLLIICPNMYSNEFLIVLVHKIDAEWPLCPHGISAISLPNIPQSSPSFPSARQDYLCWTTGVTKLAAGKQKGGANRVASQRCDGPAAAWCLGSAIRSRRLLLLVDDPAVLGGPDVLTALTSTSHGQQPDSFFCFSVLVNHRMRHSCFCGETL